MSAINTIYLDYADGGQWILSDDITFPYPRIEVCGSPLRLLQEFKAKGYILVLSDAAQLICDHDLNAMPWCKFAFRTYDYNHPECKNIF